MAKKKAKARASTTTSKPTIKGKPAAAAAKRAEPSKRARTERAITPGHIVEAREFRITDDAGVVRAVLGMTAGRGRAGSPHLSLMHEDGSEAFEVMLARDEPVMRLTDSGGRTRVFLAIAGIGSDEASIALSDGQGRPRLFIGVGSGGKPTLAVYDAAKKKVWETPE